MSGISGHASNKVIVAAGGFNDREKAQSSNEELTQAYTMHHTRKQIQVLSAIALRARVRPWFYQQETSMYFYFS